MRTHALLSMLLLGGCSSSPTGRFVSDVEAARLYKDGDALFLEVFTLKTSHVKPTLNDRVEKHDDVLSADLGLLGRLSITPTKEGLVLSGGGKRFDFTRVPDMAEAAKLDASAASQQLAESLRARTVELAEKKRCRWNEVPKLRIETTRVLVAGATVTVAEVKHENDGPWFDDYRVTGTFQLPAVSAAIADAPVCVAYDSTFGVRSCSKWGTGPMSASTKPYSASFEAFFSLPRYPRLGTAPTVLLTQLDGASVSDSEAVCELTRRKQLAYTEAPPPK